MDKIEDMKKAIQFLPIIFLFILTIPLILPLTKPGMFVSDDGEWMIIRFSAFHQAFRDGQFPVRWLGRLNHEYGYPVANFLYPGFMYLAEIPKILGFGFVDSIKIILGGSLIGAVIFSYLWLRKIFSLVSALLGATFYLYAPYHLWDLYKRGSVGEVLALAMVPFILWMIEKKNLFFSSLGMGFLILSHNTLAIIFIPVLIVYALISKYLNILVSFLFGLGLSSFFWIPAIFDLRYTRFYETQISDFSDFFANLDLLGWSTIIIFFASAILLLRFNEIYHHSKISWLFWLIGIGAAFLTIKPSSFLWQSLPTNFIQFPFRLLSVVMLTGAYLVGWVTNQLDNKQKWLAVTFLGGMIIWSAIPYIKPAAFFDKGEGFYATNEDTTTVKNEYLPRWIETAAASRPNQMIEIINGEGEADLQFQNSRLAQFQIEVFTPVQIKINRLYFPGWQAKIDGIDTLISFDNPEGLMVLSVPKGKHQISVFWTETPIRKLSDIISLVTLASLIVLRIMKIRYV